MNIQTLVEARIKELRNQLGISQEELGGVQSLIEPILRVLKKADGIFQSEHLKR